MSLEPGASTLAGVDLNLLVVLRALLEERHVTRAAAKVSSASRRRATLARLRALYDDPLLVRSGRKLVPTVRAAALLPALERALDALGETMAAPSGFEPRSARRVFRVGLADYWQAMFCGPLLARLAEEAPNVDLEISAATNPLDLLDSGAIELAAVVERDAQSHSR